MATREKQSAIDIYADLIKRSADLITVSLGPPKVDTALLAPVDHSWLTIPVTYTANDQAVRDWRAKFERIAAKHMTLEMPIAHADSDLRSPQACSISVFDAQNRLNHNDLEANFLGTTDKVPTDQHGITACFAQENGSSSVPVECFGRLFPDDARPAQDICQGPDCLSLSAHTQKSA